MTQKTGWDAFADAIKSLAERGENPCAKIELPDGYGYSPLRGKPSADMRQVFANGDNTHRFPR